MEMFPLSRGKKSFFLSPSKVRGRCVMKYSCREIADQSHSASQKLSSASFQVSTHRFV